MKLEKLLFCLLTAAVVPLFTVTLDSDSKVFASPTVFEIPLGDLKKVEKKKQYKSEKRKKKRYKNTSKADPEKTAPSATTAVPAATEKSEAPVPLVSAPAAPQPVPEPPSQPAGSTAPLAPAEPGSKTIQTASAPSEPAVRTTEESIAPPLPATDDASRISHEPYSYLVAGKLTSLMAVVISKNNVKSMHCRFRAKKDGQFAEVEMSLIPGSKFTYNAVIPALIPGSGALNYQFVMTEAQGEKVLSPEFQIPLCETVVVPGWQQELGRNRINVSLDNSSQPFEGFIGLSSK